MADEEEEEEGAVGVVMGTAVRGDVCDEAEGDRETAGAVDSSRCSEATATPVDEMASADADDDAVVFIFESAAETAV